MANEKVEGILDHLDELRNRLIVTGITFVVFFFVAFAYTKKVYLFLTLPLAKYELKLQVLRPSETIGIYFKIALITALVFSIPVIATQIWLFVKPALKRFEQRAALGYIPAFFISFVLGISFAYFIIFPMLLGFVINFGEGLFYIQYTATEYFSFLINMTLPFGVLFELPLVMMFLTTIGIVNPNALGKARKISYFILIVIAVTITPPDPISDFLVSIPLILLFELSVILSKGVYRRKLRKEAELEKQFENDAV
ncbi:MAG: preprotein translocase subunit TatC [Bacillales bacterium]|jgi:sec-independent protein translocase protein TatC|nr:preprotein translocase subunit TatC [Bacillales bacterium]